MSSLRIIYRPRLDPWDTHAIYHGIAECMDASSAPVLVLTCPDRPYISIGCHQNPELELDLEAADKLGLPIIRRYLGGGTVLLDENQLFFQFILPATSAPRSGEALYPWLIQPVCDTYAHIGIPARFRAPNDIWVGNQKIGGTGAASIADATVMAGSFLGDFDFATMAAIIHAPSTIYRAWFREALAQHMTCIQALSTTAPTAEALIRIFRQQLTHNGWQLLDSTTSEQENRAIAEARQELLDDEWLYDGGGKAVRNGIKVAAGIYLTEQTHIIGEQPYRLTLLTDQQSIRKISVIPDSEPGPYGHPAPDLSALASISVDSPELYSTLRQIDFNSADAWQQAICQQFFSE